MDFGGFTREIENTGPGAVCVLTGTEDLQKREALDVIREKMFEGKDPGMCLAEFDGRDASLAAILDELRTPPLFGGRKLVVLENARKFITPDTQSDESKKKKKAEIATLKKYGAKTSKSSVFVLVATEEIKSKKAKSKFEKIFPDALFLEARPLYDNEVAAWLVRRAKACNLQLGPHVASVLQDFFGTDLSELNGALEKLAIYIEPGKPVTREDVESFIRRRVGYNVFQFTDAIGERNLKAVLEMAGDIFEAGMIESDGLRVTNEVALFQRLMPMVAWEFKNLYRAKRFIASGGRENDAARGLQMSPFAAKKAVGHSRNYSVAECLAAEDAILKADNAIKTGGRTGVRIALEECLVRSMRRPVTSGKQNRDR